MASIFAAIAASLRPSPAASFPSPSRFKVSSSRLSPSAPFRCCSRPAHQADSGQPEKPPLSPPRKASSLLGTWSAGLGAAGFLETGYLTYLKLTNTEAFCPAGGGSCSDVLNSDYSFIFGIPLPFVGMVAYGLVALLSLQQSRKDVLSGLGEANARLLLLGTTTSMAVASGYFLYLLSTRLAGTSCSYCVASAILSFSLFFITVKDFGLEEIRKMLGIELAIAGLVVTALSYSYMSATPLFGSNEIELDPYDTEITSRSTPLAISLAKHLRSIGAKMYGAFWCSHCQEQKQMFGREAAQILEYVECYPDGVGKGRKVANECALAGIEGFPTWIIKDQVLSGEQELQDLAQASGFPLPDSQLNAPNP